MPTQTFGENEGHLKMTDGFNLFCRRWSSSSEAKRAVIFLHGIEVHSGAFRFMGSELAKAIAKSTLSIEEALETPNSQFSPEEIPSILNDP